MISDRRKRQMLIILLGEALREKVCDEIHEKYNTSTYDKLLHDVAYSIDLLTDFLNDEEH